ncbi:MAG TPA: NAD-dependent epimerase/dehydratase family protein [Phycisphaerales bacterium]|nr:NAD-dependent epimerase/dehydratase family protein [Phycisphaerales bacterium]
MPPHARQRVLVTGGAGFIGSHLTDLLLSRGHDVVVVDDLSTGRRGNLPAHHDHLTFIHDSLEHALGTSLRAERFDSIHHLAAAVGVKLVVEDPIRSISTNIHAAGALLEFAVTHGPGGSPAPTLIASSSEVYGKAAKSPFSEDDDVVYGPTHVARWSYACSKAIDEYLALAYHKQHRLPVVVARFFNTVGPRQVGDYGMVLPRFVSAALRGVPLEVHGDGTQSRCFCDVRDVSGVLPTLLDAPACHGRVFNIGSDRVVTIRELADIVLRVTGSSSGVRTVPYAEAYSTGFEDLRQRRPDLARIGEAVGFRPTIPLEKTIQDVAAWIAGASDNAPPPSH